MKTLFKSSPVKVFFTTACLLLAISTSSFAMGPKRVETQEQRKKRLAATEARAAADQRARASASSASSSSSSSSKARGGNLTAAERSLLEEGLAGGKSPTRAEEQVQITKQNKQFSSQGVVPPGVTMRGGGGKGGNKKALAAAAAAAVQHDGPERTDSFHSVTDAPQRMEGLASAAVSELEKGKYPKDKNGYFSRKVFVDFLSEECTKWRNQLQAVSTNEREALNDSQTSILNKALLAAERLHQKYNQQEISSEVDSEPAIFFPSIRELDLLAGGSQSVCSNLPMKQMTRLNFDQEIYEAIQQITEDALRSLELNQSANVKNDLKVVTYLDSYSRLSFDGDLILTNVRTKLLEGYDKLIAQALQEQKEFSGFVETGGEDALTLWCFEDSIENNKEKLQSVLKLLEDGSKSVDSRRLVLVPLKEGALLQYSPSAVRESQDEELKEDSLMPSVELKQIATKAAGAVISKQEKSSQRQAPSNVDWTNSFEKLHSFTDSSSPVDDPRSSYYSTFCKVISGTSVAALIAAMAYEWYLHSLQASS